MLYLISLSDTRSMNFCVSWVVFKPCVKHRKHLRTIRKFESSYGFCIRNHIT